MCCAWTLVIMVANTLGILGDLSVLYVQYLDRCLTALTDSMVPLCSFTLLSPVSSLLYSDKGKPIHEIGFEHTKGRLSHKF